MVVAVERLATRWAGPRRRGGMALSNKQGAQEAGTVSAWDWS